MQGNPMDMFDELDGIFACLFSRMDREFTVCSPSGYEYHITFSNAEGPTIPETAGNACPVSHVRGEPVAEVHRIGNEVKVITDLPGITEETLRLAVKGTTLIIDAGDADHSFRTSAPLPPVDAGSLQKTLKNGVLEVTFMSLPEPSENT